MESAFWKCRDNAFSVKTATVPIGQLIFAASGGRVTIIMAGLISWLAIGNPFIISAPVRP